MALFRSEKSLVTAAVALRLSGFVGLGAFIFAPGPSWALSKVKGYFTANITTAPINSSFAVGDRLRFDFMMTNVPSSTNSSSLNKWNTTTSSPVKLFQYFMVNKCAASSPVTDPCSSISSISSTSKTILDTANQQFAVAPNVPANWGSNSASNPLFSLQLAGLPSSYTGVKINQIKGVANAEMTNLQFGSQYDNMMGDTLQDVLANTLSWKPISAGVSNYSAQNIVDNASSPSGFQVLTKQDPSAANFVNYTGLMTFYTGTESTGARFNVNGVNFTEVPGPLPIFGSATAFAYSRRLRRRVKSVSA